MVSELCGNESFIKFTKYQTKAHREQSIIKIYFVASMTFLSSH